MSKKNNRFKKVKPPKIEPIEWIKDSDEDFSFIAGYTSGGAAYGLTWEEYDPNNIDPNMSTNKQPDLD
jgi:hypothetical protein